MKKFLALFFALVLVISLVACGNGNENEESGSKKPEASESESESNTEAGGSESESTPGGSESESTPGGSESESTSGGSESESTPGGEVEKTPMTYDEYLAAAIDEAVLVEAYVQATQSWWDNKITAYLQDRDGAYFAYEMACTEEDAAKLVPGTKIRVSGYKAEWSGEIEIVDATFTFVEGADTYVAEPVDLTDVLANETELVKYQNQLAIFKGVTIEAIEYRNDAPGDDIYVTVKQGEGTYSFCVERYLTGPETDVYKAFESLKVGDEVNITGFVYWYNGINTHITGIEIAAAAPDAAMTYEEYVAAAIDEAVLVEAYVQATQSWWDNKITVYLQDRDGAYFAYQMACTEEDAAKLVPGTKIRVSGYKAEWSGEIEIVDATFTFVEGADTYVAEPVDLTDVLANETELVKYQNQLTIFKGVTIEAIEYRNDAPGDDIYVTVKQGEETYSFCVERYLTGPETDVYKAFAELKVGDVVDITGFVYWYNGVNTHITNVVANG